MAKKNKSVGFSRFDLLYSGEVDSLLNTIQTRVDINSLLRLRILEFCRVTLTLKHTDIVIRELNNRLFFELNMFFNHLVHEDLLDPTDPSFIELANTVTIYSYVCITDEYNQLNVLIDITPASILKEDKFYILAVSSKLHLIQ